VPEPDLARAGELAHRYAAAVDDGLIEAAAGLFAPDAVLRLPDPPRDLRPVTAHHGREEIHAALSAVLDLRATVHEITGQVLEPIGAGYARGRISCAAHHFLDRPGASGEGHSDLVWRVRYDDEYAVREGRWCIAARSMTVIAVGLSPVRAVLPRGGD
jgi:hypothetical protein